MKIGFMQEQIHLFIYSCLKIIEGYSYLNILAEIKNLTKKM
jgi:hypothetical protein